MTEIPSRPDLPPLPPPGMPLVSENSAEVERTLAELQRSFLQNPTDLVLARALIRQERVERERAERRAVRSEVEYEQVFNLAPDGICLIDRNLQILRINRALGDMLGLEPDSVRGKLCCDVIFGSACRTRRCALRSILQGKHYVEYEMEKETPPKKPIRLQVTGTPLYGSAGEIVGVIETFKDISTRRLSEDDLSKSREYLSQMNRKLRESQAQLVQSEKMASIGQLAAGIAHEINNPTGFVLSNLRTLGDYTRTFLELLTAYGELARSLAAGTAVGSPEMQERLSRIQALETKENLVFIREDVLSLLKETQDGAERIREIVLSLKSFARHDETDMRDCDLNELVETTIRVLWNELKYKCEVEKHLGPIPMVRCYPGQLHQVLMNLLINAAQAIDTQGKIRIETTVNPTHVILRVRDNGKGIAPENLKRLFEPFFTTKPEGQGTGLGLYISYGIIERHRGQIWVESAPREGTLFTVALPREPEVASSDPLPVRGDPA